MRDFLSSFIENPTILDLTMATITLMSISGILEALFPWLGNRK